MTRGVALCGPLAALCSTVVSMNWLGRSDDKSRAMADQVHKKHGGFDERRALEVECAKFAGLKDGWHVVLWIPAPQMRMKAARVLVDDGAEYPLEDFDRAAGHRGEEVYDSHEALWSVMVYVHRDVDDTQRQVILSWLSDRMGVRWAPDQFLTGRSEMAKIAAARVAKDHGLSSKQEEDLAVEVAARGGAENFDDLVAV